MSYSLVDMALKSQITDPTEAAVLVALAHHADEYCSCYPSIQRLCQVSRYKERAVQGAIKRLAERGIIRVKTGGGRGGSSFYTILPSALNPAVDAGITADKPRSRRTVLEAKTPQQMRETPHLTTENPAADAPEPVIEPVKNKAKPCEAESGKDRVHRFRAAIIEALGLTGRELNTSGTFVVTGMDPRNLEAALMVWASGGLNDDQIIAAIRGKIASERAKDAAFLPRSVKLFDGPIADFAKRMAGCGQGQQASQKAHKAQPLIDPIAEAERIRLVGELAGLRGSNSDASFARRDEIVTRLKTLESAAEARP